MCSFLVTRATDYVKNTFNFSQIYKIYENFSKYINIEWFKAKNRLGFIWLSEQQGALHPT